MSKGSSVSSFAIEEEDIEVETETFGPIKLYTSTQHPGQWIAHASGLGWVMFPARANGWDDRRPARGLDPMHVRQVPQWHALNAGLPGTIPDSRGGKAA